MTGSKGKSPSRPAKGGNKRHKQVHRDVNKGITKPALRRLARRGGVKRIAHQCYDDARNLVRSFVESVVYYSVIYKSTRGKKAKVIGLKDVVFALKRRGNALVGAEQYQKKKAKKGGKGKKK